MTQLPVSELYILSKWQKALHQNLYYNKYTSQVEEELNSKGRITLKEGDIVSVTVKNTNKTISQMLRNFFYMVSGNESYQISAQQAGVVAVNGSTNN